MQIENVLVEGVEMTDQHQHYDAYRIKGQNTRDDGKFKQWNPSEKHL